MHIRTCKCAKWLWTWLNWLTKEFSLHFQSLCSFRDNFRDRTTVSVSLLCCWAIFAMNTFCCISATDLQLSFDQFFYRSSFNLLFRFLSLFASISFSNGVSFFVTFSYRRYHFYSMVLFNENRSVGKFHVSQRPGLESIFALAILKWNKGKSEAFPYRKGGGKTLWWTWNEYKAISGVVPRGFADRFEGNWNGASMAGAATAD